MTVDYTSIKSMVLMFNMSNFDQQGIDLNLLTVFGLLMRERSVTAAARRLSLGQPAVSHALARLRRLLGDPLFVRNGRTMEPTPRAEELARSVGPALLEIETALRAAQPFDPGTDTRTLRLAMSDDLLVAYLPAIAGELGRRMPRSRLVVRQVDYLVASRVLEDREASLVVGYLERLPAAARRRTLRQAGYRVLMDSDGTGPLDLAEYCRRPHVLVTFAADLVGYVDETLAGLGAGRQIGLSVPAFALLPSLIAGTDQLATVPDYVAEAMARRFGLAASPLPFESPTFDVSMAWHPAMDRDPAERVLREVVAAAIRS